MSRQQLDDLLDWYDRFKPGQVTEAKLNVTRKTIMAWGIKPEERGGQLVYRGRLLKPAERHVKKAEEQASI